MSRPKTKIKPTVIDLLIETVGFFALMLMLMLPIYYYDQLPDKIPTHFGMNGEANAWSNKNSIWILPAVETVMYSGLWILVKYPHVFNYLVPITEENAYKQYQLATRFIRILNSLIAVMILFILYNSIQTALSIQSGLGNKMFIFLVAIFGSLGAYIYASIRNK